MSFDTVWPAYCTVEESFSPASVVGDLAPTRVLFIAGEGHRIVPPAHAARLLAVASAPKV